MRVHHPHNYRLSIHALSQLVFLWLLLTGLTGAQEPDSKKISDLIDRLKHPDAMERLTATQALRGARKWGKEAVPQLIKMLEDDDYRVGISAIETIGEFRGEAKEAVPQLIQVLKEPGLYALYIGDALGKIGKEAKEAVVPPLREILNDPDVTARRNAAYALGRVGEEAEEAVPQLIEALRDPDNVVRRNAAEALGEIRGGAKDAVPRLIETLQDPAPFVRIIAAKALAEFSTVIAREKATEFSEQLNTAAEIMRNSPEPGVKQYADRVQQASDLLNLLWWEQLKQWVVAHPAISLVIVGYPLLMLAWLVVLWLRPLWLLHINEALANTTDVKLPEKLGGFNVAPRYLILVGFFHYQSRVLDAWVTKYIGSAQKMFSGLPTVEERKIYVPLPVVLGNDSEADLSPGKLRPLGTRSLICLQIWGEGGAGKTSLACRLAQWAMSSQKEVRLNADHRMLPVLIEQDLVIQDKDPEHALFRAIKQQVRVMINEDDPPPAELLRQLLKKRRVLVIVDGFSEMNEASRTATLAGITDLPLNASIITTRADEQLGGIPKTEIKPLRVKGNRLATFMEAYLTARRKRDLFEDEEYFEACRRLSLIVGDRDITALLAKLYAEQMIALKEAATDGDAPENIPDLMLSYLNDLCRNTGPDEPDIRVVHYAAKSIAWKCLEKRLRPMPARREDVLSTLGGDEKGMPLLQYLEEKLKVVQTVGAGRDRIRFSLDPLAEYLAGMHLIDEQGEDAQAWRSFLARIDEQGGEPEDVKGFLLAVRDCCLAKGKDVPSLNIIADELATRAGVNLEEGNRYKIERRVRQLMARLKYSEAKDRIHAVEELALIGKPARIAIKDLCVLLRDHDINVRMSVVDALKGIGTKEVVPHLVEALKDPDPNVRWHGAASFLDIKVKEAVPQLSESLKDPDATVRRCAALALGNIGAAEAIPHLSEALDDSDPIVSDCALNALYKIGMGVSKDSEF